MIFKSPEWLVGLLLCIQRLFGNFRLMSSHQKKEERKEEKRKGIDRSKIEETKTPTKTVFRTCRKHSRPLPYYLFPLLLIFYQTIMPTQMRKWNGNCLEHDQTIY